MTTILHFHNGINEVQEGKTNYRTEPTIWIPIILKDKKIQNEKL